MKAFLSLDNIHKELKDKNYMEIRCKHTGLDGVTESCSLTITVVDRRDGEPVTATLTIRSIENMLRQEEAQRELLVLTAQRAEAANHAKSDFLSNMSHDIRTPMNAILGMTNIAVTHIDDKKRVMDALNKIRLSGKHLLGLINSVLDMSKIESGKLSLNEEAFNIREAAENLLNLVHSQIEEKSLELKVDAIQIEHENVTGDEQRLQQILINIIGNAIKFTPDGGRITLNLQEKISEVSDRGCYQFIIEDTGIGMESDFVNKIFEPFSRAADSRITHIEGSGLGMSIAINIARMMGGDIKVESELGKGSKVTVTVYLKTDYDRKTESEEGKEPEMAVFQNHDYSGKRVLLVEDNELNIEVAGELLTMVGFTVEYAYNGREAVDKVVKNPAGYYSMVFMDIQMPVMNGYEAAAAIRAEGRPDLKELAIVAMTADAFADDVKKAHEAGMNGHIAKPIDVSRLEQVIEKWIA
jgi:signal transduction histidine kinase/ActR/RegA family two-component response regulator